MIYKRLITLPEKPKQGFFLWGSRQTGKTTLLKETYPDAFRIDLLRSDLMIAYQSKPGLLREEISALPDSQLIVIDEIQKVPALLDEIHYIIQEFNRSFILCGSSARKVRHGHANLLGGRAHRYELLGLSARELGSDFNLERILNRGPLPSHYLNDDFLQSLRGYVDDYLKEEVLQEGLVRKLPLFSDFLRSAGIGDTEIVNLSNIARECGVSVATVREHYRILEDTLIGCFVPSFTLRPKRRSVHAPKFYFRDVGIVNHLAKRGRIQPGSEIFGKAFENWIFHELSVHSRYSGLWYDISYWRLTTGTEVDFILGQGNLAIEAKGKEKITDRDLKGLREFKKEYPDVKHLCVVSLIERTRKTNDGILILHYKEFLDKLWNKEYAI